MHSMWAKQKRQSGFTIVELLIVIVVIGILAAITIVSFNGVTAKAKFVGYQSDLKNTV
jgi:prepilin-type N-terminal cleavage/methylation domain-containing protein